MLTTAQYPSQRKYKIHWQPQSRTVISATHAPHSPAKNWNTRIPIAAAERISSFVSLNPAFPVSMPDDVSHKMSNRFAPAMPATGLVPDGHDKPRRTAVRLPLPPSSLTVAGGYSQISGVAVLRRGSDTRTATIASRKMQGLDGTMVDL